MRKRHRSLVFETPEARMLLAGDCAAEFDGETLKVRCDDAPNQIAVFENSGGRLIVNGRGNTRVNGSTGPTSLGSAEDLANVLIRTNGRDDTVLVRDLAVKRSIDINTGGGGDRAIGRRLRVGGDIKIDTARGRDAVNLRDDIGVGNNLEVTTGQGNDAVVAMGIRAVNDVTIETGGEHDIVTARRLRAGGTILLDGGPGFDRLRRDLDTIFGDLKEENFERIIEL